MVWMEFRILNFFKNSQGQSVVEYILLMVVLMSLAFGVFNSRYFKDFFDEDSTFFSVLSIRIEHSYRNALFVEDNNLDYNSPHPSFHNSDSGGSRFFVSKDVYPF